MTCRRLPILPMLVLATGACAAVPDDRALHCGTAWLASRIDGGGTISTAGNTRVFDGGESFLGTPKAMAWADAVRALFDAGRATRDPTFTTIGSRVWARHR
ncbi:MAG TPA: hypothetical protein VFN90_10860 [Gemmatimonadales bacterium]|nr:hypothetical protein [Gemmatimonadales bacterium]